MGSFRGFPLEGVDFYQRLIVDNTREFWAVNKSTYDDAIRQPIEDFTSELAAEFGEFKLFRPNRDVRFSKDKSPYKEHQGAVTEGEGGEFYYIQISAEGLFVASGYYQLASDQLARFRAAVDDDVTGEDLVARLAEVPRVYTIGGHELKTAPRGYSREHPRVNLLQHKGITVGRQFGSPAWMATKGAAKRVIECWHAADRVNEWLNRNVGPSHLAPEEPR